jgi:predicted phage terminase large subunit-like protein
VSYGATLAEVAAVKMRRLVMGPWYQEHWGGRVKILSDQASRSDFGNSAGGERISNSIEGGILGRGGDIQIIDDPHKVKGAESDVERESTLTAMREGLPTRITDPRISARILVMQRLHAADATDYALNNWREPRHTMLPMRFDPDRACEVDVREEDGELLWPLVWTDEAVDSESAELGTYGTAGQLQQSPIPRGGGIIATEQWQLWEGDDYPPFGTCVASLDTAYKIKQEADYNALTVWAGFAHPESGKPKVMLRDAWRARLSLSDLVARVVKTCRDHKVDVLLIEDASRGLDVQDEIYQLIGKREIRIILIPPAADKAARLMSTEPLFSNSIVYAPDREWAQDVIDEVSVFPRGRHDDYVDSTSQALNYLRRTGVAVRREEHDEEVLGRRMYRKPSKPVYDV